MNKHDKKYCRGCRDDFYNGKNSIGVKECWSYPTAKVVRRYKIGWWTRPDSPGAFTKIKTHDCHWEPGKYGFYEELPAFAVDVREEGSG